MEIRADLVILGAGPTGLGALQRFFELQSENYIGKHTKVLIIEKESEAGGLSKTVTDENGFKWDLGVHVIGSSRFPAFLKMLTDTLPEWNQIKRCVKADITGIGGKDDRKTVYAPYPVQNSIHYFPTAIRDKCLSELEKITKLNEPTNFADFSEIHFGKTLQSEFIRPYNEKVWTVKLEEMNCRWVEGRVPKIDLTLLRKRCKSPLIIDENEQEEPIFRYPAKCNGIGELWQRLADSFSQKHFLYNTEVLRIDSREKKIIVRNSQTAEMSEITYELMISTLPLIELNNLCGGLFADIKLKHSTVILVGIALKKPQNAIAQQLSWAYYPRNSISFYRCTILSNFSTCLTPDSNTYWSVLCEIGRKPDSERESKDELVFKVIQDLISVEIIDNPEQVYSTYYCVIPYGYPIPTLDRDALLETYLNAFEDLQIFSRGRFGQWKYELSNTDHCFEIGRQAVEKLYLDIDERLI